MATSSHCAGSLAYDLGFRGEFGAAVELLDTRSAGAWRGALAGQLWMAGQAAGGLPTTDEVAAIGSNDGEAAGQACVQAEHAAFLRFDAEALQRWLLIHNSILQKELAGDDPVSKSWLQVGRAFELLLQDQIAELEETTVVLEREAAAQGLAPVVVEAAALRAFALLSRGELDEATAVARRAARMARTEELPQPQYLANIVLARVRRFQNRPHLAVRILVALSRKAPAVWRSWLRWELLLAGGPGLLSELPVAETDRVDAADTVADLLHVAREGDGALVEAAIERARRVVRFGPGLAGDLQALHCAIDANVDLERGGPTMHAWCLGEGELPPDGLVGMATAESSPGDAVLACVAAQGDHRCRRILAVGAPMVGPMLRSSRPGRLETAIAVVALAGKDGVDKESFFRSVYGFEFVSHLHQAPLDMLLHRARQLLSEHAELHRDDEVMRLTIRTPFTVPDPRCARPIEDQLLRAIAQSGGGTAREVAQALGVPLRSVQAALKGLVEDGACLSEKDGRKVAYRVEDTTFQEPTRTELKTA